MTAQRPADRRLADGVLPLVLIALVAVASTLAVAFAISRWSAERSERAEQSRQEDEIALVQARTALAGEAERRRIDSLFLAMGGIDPFADALGPPDARDDRGSRPVRPALPPPAGRTGAPPGIADSELIDELIALAGSDEAHVAAAADDLLMLLADLTEQPPDTIVDAIAIERGIASEVWATGSRPGGRALGSTALSAQAVANEALGLWDLAEWFSLGLVVTDRAPDAVSELDRALTPSLLDLESLSRLNQARATSNPLDRRLSPERAAVLDPALSQEFADLLASEPADRLRAAVEWSGLAVVGETDDPPGTLDQVIEDTLRLGDRVDLAIRRTLTERRTAAGEAASAAEASAWQWLAAAVGLIGLASSVTAVLIRRRYSYDHALEHAASSDPLTGLGNRTLLRNQIARVLADPELPGHALLHIDLDRFKAVNDTHGHGVGDDVLVAVAERCRAALDGRRGMVVRLGGDELAIALTGRAEPEDDARAIAERIHDLLAAPIETDGPPIRMTVSIGIAIAHGPTELDDLLVESDVALHEAKRRGRARTVVFSTRDVRMLLQRLPEAIREGAITNAYQPQFRTGSLELTGAEVLARWQHPDGSQRPAHEWISALEWAGATRHLVESSLRSVRAAIDTFGAGGPPRLWINLLPSDLTRPGASMALLELMTELGVPAHRLGVELTETVDLLDPEGIGDALAVLHSDGVAIALDDFGSGPTPLRLLTTLPVDMVKIDRSVVAGIDHNQPNQSLVRGLVGIAERADFELVALGVETAAELEAVTELGVGHVQGHLTGTPVDLPGLVDATRAMSAARGGPPTPPTVPGGPPGDTTGR